MEVAPQVYLVPGVIANTYVITEPDGITLIDAALPGNRGKVLRYIQSLGYQPSDVKRIIITHADIDHVGSLEAIREATGAKVMTSQVEANAIQEGKPSRELMGRGVLGMLMKLVQKVFPPRRAQVDEILSPGQELPVLGGLQVISTPGHTPGHISLWSPSGRILFSGDSILVRPEGFLPSQGMNNWDVTESLESFRKERDLQPVLVLGGHGWTGEEIERKFTSS